MVEVSRVGRQSYYVLIDTILEARNSRNVGEAFWAFCQAEACISLIMQKFEDGGFINNEIGTNCC